MSVFRFLLFSFFALVVVLPDAVMAGTAETVSFKTKYAPGSILISNGKRKLWYILENGKAIRYSIAVGKPEELWTGTRMVSRKAKNPTWIPTKSMREKNPNLPKSVPGGPSNPLGVRAIYLDHSLYRIHGTNSPSSIGRSASAGCFRMFNSDVVHLYKRVHIGAPVIVVN